MNTVLVCWCKDPGVGLSKLARSVRVSSIWPGARPANTTTHRSGAKIRHNWSSDDSNCAVCILFWNNLPSSTRTRRKYMPGVRQGGEWARLSKGSGRRSDVHILGNLRAAAKSDLDSVVTEYLRNREISLT